MSHKIYVCYDRSDYKYFKDLLNHISILEKMDLIEMIDVVSLSQFASRMHGDYKEYITSKIDSADVVLLLLSADLLGSKSIYEYEVSRIIERHKSNSLLLIPIIIRHVFIDGTFFSELATLPKNNKPIQKWFNKDEAWVDVVGSIRKMLEEHPEKWSINVKMPAMQGRCSAFGYKEGDGCYIRKINIINIKSTNHFEWSLEDDEFAPGWHILLGDNGSGKTTLVTACAAALIGYPEIMPSRISWRSWVRRDCNEASVEIQLGWEYIQQDELRQNIFPLSLGIKIDSFSEPKELSDSPRPNDGFSEYGRWFSAGFGPFRRFSGGRSEYNELFRNNSRLSRFLSAFGEGVALTEIEPWLQKLRFAQLEGRSEEGKLLDDLTLFINQPGFLPTGVWLKEVTSKAVTFVDAQGCEVDMNELSDGFRSILSLTFELIRQMALVYKGISIFNEGKTAVIAPGVVFVDEIDVHLHPRWQRAIGPWLTRCFPKVQFFVTTHSLLVCQGAYPHGSVWRLPDPDPEQQGNPVGRITGVPLKRLLFGNLLEVVSSGAFGTGVERSDEGRKMLEELAQLNRRSFKGQLSEEEKTRRRELMEIFGASDDEEELS